MKKKKELTNPENTLESTLFSLATLKPQNKHNLKYVNLGPFLGKNKFD